VNIAEYILIDCATGLVHGPYETCEQARGKANDFPAWEIVDSKGALIDWSRSDAQATSG
jgi:hypothetical protein